MKLRSPFIFLLFFGLISCSTPPKTEYQQLLYNYQHGIKPEVADGLQNPPLETKALWIVRSSIKTKKDIDRVIENMANYGLNTAIVQVRGLGDVLYKSKMEPMADEVEEGLDPLQYFLDQAEKHQISVQAWVNVVMISKPDFLSSFSKRDQHLTNKHPKWVLQDQNSRSMLDYPLEELSADWMDGAYLDPAKPEVRKYLVRIVQEILKAYKLDGIHLDFIRYPYAKEGEKLFGLDREFVQSSQKLSPLRTTEDYLKYPQYQKALDLWKLQQMNYLVKSIHEVIQKSPRKPKLTAAVWAHKKKVYENVYQDWPLWLDRGWLDEAYMMVYVMDKEKHDLRMEEFFERERMKKVVVGIGLYREPKAKTIKHQILSSRAISAKGFCIFSAQSLEEFGEKPKYSQLKSWIQGESL